MQLERWALLEKFQCLGDACPDTCCQGWGMQVDKAHIDLYAAKAPELLSAVTSGEADYVMRRDPATDHCIKFDQGWGLVRASNTQPVLVLRFEAQSEARLAEIRGEVEAIVAQAGGGAIGGVAKH